MKSLVLILSTSLFSLSLSAIQLKDNNFKLPKIKYSQLKKMGMSDTEEIKTKASIKKLLKDETMAISLRNPTDVDNRTYSFVQEIDLEAQGWNVRLYKNKARVALFNFVKKNWDQLSKTTLNNSGSEDFSKFGPLLGADLKDNMLVRASSNNWIVFDVSWAKIKIRKNKTLAQVVIQQDYLGDNNDLNELAYSVKAAPSNKKKKPRMDRDSKSYDEPRKNSRSNDLFEL